ncbi:MAG: hypothetical protein J6A05_06960 [Oscillospiraceae bacterium]|nr:hypothetical protein [Oscillospiraceae bacterium]
MTEQELRKLLENVSDSYSDFVTCGIRTAKKHNCIDKLGNYIKNNPTATTSDIIWFESREILKIKTIMELLQEGKELYCAKCGEGIYITDDKDIAVSTDFYCSECGHKLVWEK